MAKERTRRMVILSVSLLLLASTTPLALGEALNVNTKPCPDELPRAACFGTEESRSADWSEDGAVRLPFGPTTTYVQALLQTALEVEHSTIPLYLTTMYSIIDQSSFAATTMRSVVMEEMLHMVNAANVLNAIGGTPFFDHPDFIPKYPLTLPVLNITADIVWFTQTSVSHYETLESTPPGGYNTSISALYLHIMNLLTALCQQYGEDKVFVGNHSYQVPASIPGESAPGIYSLSDAKIALLGVAEQGGGCPIKDQPFPEFSNISAGPLGGTLSHAARYAEILMGQMYQPTDVKGIPTGAKVDINWTDVRRFSPNPSTNDFLPEQCVAGGSWVVRNASFFVKTVWDQHNHHLHTTNETSWEDCAKRCTNWTTSYNKPLEPCAMWTWRNSTTVTVDGAVVPAQSCMLAQGGGPVIAKLEGFMSGCQFGTVCNNTLPMNANMSGPMPKPSPSLLKQCDVVHQAQLDFASNYTALLVSLHDVFNGNPAGLMPTLSQMYALKSLAIALMETPDPRIASSQMGVGPPWEYIPSASQYEARGRLARPTTR